MEGAPAREVLSEADLRMIAKACRFYRSHRSYTAEKNGHKPTGLDQLDRIEKIVVALAESKKHS